MSGCPECQTEESQLSMDQRMENEQLDLAVIASEEERDLAKVLGDYNMRVQFMRLFTLSLLRA